MATDPYSLSSIFLGDLNKEIKDRTGIKVDTVNRVTRALFKAIVNHMEAGRAVDVWNFGIFYGSQSKGRLITLPDRSSVFIPDHDKPKVMFKRSVKLRIREESIKRAKEKTMENPSTEISWDDQNVRHD